MSQNIILSGGRAQLSIGTKVVGFFTNCSWGLAYDVTPSYILGRMGPAEITYTGQEPVNVTCTGFRMVVNGGQLAPAGMTQLASLLTAEDTSLDITDKVTGKSIMKVYGVRATGYDSDVAARSISSFTVRFMGTRLETDGISDGEAPGAADLLSGGIVPST